MAPTPEDPETFLAKAFLFVKEHEWMVNSYIAEFFTQDLWNKLPLRWRECLELATLSELHGNVLTNSGQHTYRRVWPLSLLAFISTCHSLSIPRQHKNISHETNNYDLLDAGLLLQDECDHKCGDGNEVLTSIFAKHIKNKKRHELAVLPSLIDGVCKKLGVTKIVDIGSGLGHLSRLLALKYGYSVTAIEMADKRLPLAAKFDRELELELRKMNVTQDRKIGSVSHIAREIRPGISVDEFRSLLLSGSVGDPVSESGCVLVGLHTCGDLASTMLKVFLSAPSVKGVVSVSCCYMRMTLKGDCVGTSSGELLPAQACVDNRDSHSSRCECRPHDGAWLECPLSSTRFCCGVLTDRRKALFFSERTLNALCWSFQRRRASNRRRSPRSEEIVKEEANSRQSKCSECDVFAESTMRHCDEEGTLPSYGFPLSRCAHGFGIQPFKYKAFEAACHFVDDYAKKLLAGSPKLKLHCYRAVMEVCLRRLDPKLALSLLRCKKIKNAADLSFTEYAERVFQRLKVPFSEQMLSELGCLDMLARWKDVVAFYSLVVLLGPVVEAVVIYDKLAFLAEHGLKASVYPLFDPKISPRNLVLVSTR